MLIGQGETFGQVAGQVEFYKDAIAEAEAEFSPQRVVVARAMHAASTTEKARQEAEIPFMWFKQTGQEVSAPPGHRVDLLPEEYAAYRSRYSQDARFDYHAMCDNVMLFGSSDHIAERIGLMRESGVDN